MFSGLRTLIMVVVTVALRARVVCVDVHTNGSQLIFLSCLTGVGIQDLSLVLMDE